MKKLFLATLALLFCTEVSAFPPRPKTPHHERTQSSSSTRSTRSTKSSASSTSLPSLSKKSRQKVRFNNEIKIRTFSTNKNGEEVVTTKTRTRLRHPSKKSSLYQGADPAPAKERLILPAWKL